jgi:hypothetical protein
VFEVPLDDCLSVNLYAKYQEKITGRKRRNNPTGHIHFFNKETTRKIVNESGGIILKERTYRELRTQIKGSMPELFLRLFKTATFYFVFKISDSKLVGTNHAILTTKGMNNSARANYDEYDLEAR